MHWDGKLLPDLFSYKKVDDLPKVATEPDIKSFWKWITHVLK